MWLIVTFYISHEKSWWPHLRRKNLWSTYWLYDSTAIFRTQNTKTSKYNLPGIQVTNKVQSKCKRW